jgi:hypothetical protein
MQLSSLSNLFLYICSIFLVDDTYGQRSVTNLYIAWISKKKKNSFGRFHLSAFSVVKDLKLFVLMYGSFTSTNDSFAQKAITPLASCTTLRTLSSTSSTQQ